MTIKPKRSTHGFAPVPAQPTTRNVETALSFLDAHRRASDPEPVCRWCRQHWPYRAVGAARPETLCKERPGAGHHAARQPGTAAVTDTRSVHQSRA
jgi:hypothetical protein